ncbi:class I SAM-dependent methyltransferase [Amycolatopsis tucumanensis]|uniref:Class I SAM-dependent methyltransferase n=1 Tax=Amycolatopsis tucumanensis TaxID=401106 RepID=A0ABP7JWW4_9PSEU|nr:class I SAM-dependent methyltransferase [Amycolatopsis tucumanensis]MCF6427685.1 class I SAM-dependent methyltransferase [Amycolatopsis tucumanensis]
MALSNQRRADKQVANIRDDAVRDQYADASAASGYVAAHESGPSTRYFFSRLHVVDEALAPVSGDLLDIGCGPGILISHLLATRPGEFRITACDRSPAMIDAVAERTGHAGVRLSVARIEEMPFPDDSFDVVVAMGVLEYAEVRQALRELARVTRPGGLAVVTMLNPLSPYRTFEWCVYWPTLRLLGRLERLLGVPSSKRHGVPRSGIRALPARRLRRLLRNAGFHPRDLVYYDVTPFLPPVDKIVRRWKQGWRHHPDKTVSRGASRWLGTGYLVTARRAD